MRIAAPENIVNIIHVLVFIGVSGFSYSLLDDDLPNPRIVIQPKAGVKCPGLRPGTENLYPSSACAYPQASVLVASDSQWFCPCEPGIAGGVSLPGLSIEPGKHATDFSRG
jgi:hypothetical protein